MLKVSLTKTVTVTARLASNCKAFLFGLDSRGALIVQSVRATYSDTLCAWVDSQHSLKACGYGVRPSYRPARDWTGP